MLQKPFNESLLWKGQIQQNQKKSTISQPPMVLPKINSLTGHYAPQRPSIHEELLFRYSVYSAEYWRGVKERQRKYRILHYQDKYRLANQLY
jgi:hypothetical protein